MNCAIPNSRVGRPAGQLGSRWRYLFAVLLLGCGAKQGIGVALTLQLDSAAAVRKDQINRLTFAISGDETDSESVSLMRLAFQDGEERVIYRPKSTTVHLTIVISGWRDNDLIASGSTGELTVQPSSLTPVTVRLIEPVVSTDMSDSDASSVDGAPRDLEMAPDLLSPSDLWTSPITFQMAMYSGSTNLVPVAVAAGRFNSSPELPRGCALVSGSKVYMNSRGCVIGSAPGIDIGTPAVAIAKGDFNGDGWTDFVTANFTASTATVLLSDGQGTGEFLAPVNYPVEAGPIDVVAIDLNQDGLMDWATANRTGHSISIFLNGGTGAFTLGQTLSNITGSLNAIAAGNLYRVDHPRVSSTGNDIVVASDTGLQVFFDSGDKFTLIDGFETRKVNAVKVADLDGNGKDEIVALLPGTGQSQSQIQAYVQFSPSTPVPVNNAVNLVLEDFNLDGQIDLAVGTAKPGLAVYAGLGSGFFVFSQSYDLGKTPSVLVTGEFISSTLGKRDLIVIVADQSLIFSNTSP